MSTEPADVAIIRRGRGRPRTAFKAAQHRLSQNAKPKADRGKRSNVSASSGVLVLDGEETAPSSVAAQAPPALPEPDPKRPTLDLGKPYNQRIREQSEAFFANLARIKEAEAEAEAEAEVIAAPPPPLPNIGSPAAEGSESSSFSLTGTTDAASFVRETGVPPDQCNAGSTALQFDELGFEIPAELAPIGSADNDADSSSESGTDDSYEYVAQKKTLARSAIAPPATSVNDVATISAARPLSTARVEFRRAMRNIFIWQLGTAIRACSSKKVADWLPIDPAVEKMFPAVPTLETMNSPERQLIDKWQSLGLALLPRRASFDMEKNIKRCNYLVVQRMPKMTLVDSIADPESINWCQICAHRKPVIGQERPAEYIAKLGFSTRGELLIFAHTECCTRLVTCHRNLHCMAYMRRAMTRLWNQEELEKGPFPLDEKPLAQARRLWGAVYNNERLFEEVCVSTEQAMEEGEIRLKQIQEAAAGGHRDDRVGLY